MPVSTADAQALAAALLEADRVVVLTGLRLGGPEERDDTHAGGQWAARANLEAFLTEPASFWEYFYPTAVAVADREPTPDHLALARLQRAGAVAALITQAVDRHHARAGSTDVV